jgi:hypothetical protein
MDGFKTLCRIAFLNKEVGDVSGGFFVYHILQDISLSSPLFCRYQKMHHFPPTSPVIVTIRHT